MAKKPAGKGHNTALTEAEERSLHMDHVAKIKAARQKVKDAQEGLKGAFKTATLDGCVKKDLERLEELSSVRDPMRIQAETKRDLQLQQWCAMPTFYQPDMFEDREPLVERAKKEGYAAGMLAKDRESGNPYAIDSEAGQTWVKAYDAAQKDQRENLKNAMEKKQALRDELIHGTARPEKQPEASKETPEGATLQ